MSHFLKRLSPFLKRLTIFLKNNLRLYTIHFTPNTIKITPIVIFIWSCQKNVVYLHPQFHAGGVCASSAGVADIFKRRLLALCSDVQKCRSFNHVQDLATIDVLRDIDYPSCAYLVRLLRIYMCAYAYLNYVARENVYIRRGLRVVGLTWWAMRQPLNVERQQSESTLFVCLYVTLINNKYQPIKN